MTNIVVGIRNDNAYINHELLWTLFRLKTRLEITTEKVRRRLEQLLPKTCDEGHV